ncbi:MAG: hypothetical protein ACYC9L_03115 [Sulfuricaulis sp.]
MTRYVHVLLSSLCLVSVGAMAQSSNPALTSAPIGQVAQGTLVGPPAQAPEMGPPVAGPTQAPANASTPVLPKAMPAMSPEEMRAAEALNQQVAEHYATAGGNSGFAQAPAPGKPRTGIKPPPASITVKPGVNVLFGIAQGHLNRLVTPFRNPIIKTTAAAAMSVEKNVVYVSTNNTEPVGFYIHDANDVMDAISVTMVPADIPPVSVTLNLDGYSAKTDQGTYVAGDAKLANTWETASPFVDMIRNSFRDLAKGKIPDGYSFETLRTIPATMPHCAMPGLRIEPRQLLTGFNVSIIVSRVTNIGDVPADIDEKSCDADQVLAVASWPTTTVAARGEDELYIAVRKPNENERDDKRPSLLPEGAR